MKAGEMKVGNAMTSIPDQSVTGETSSPFQFRILDVVLVTTLAALLLGAMPQLSAGLLWLFAALALYSLIFVWKVKLWGILQTAGYLTVAALILCALLLPAIQSAPRSGRRPQCMNNLKCIGIALHNYHDVYGSFPPAYIADENGKPMHSWRVLILPFMEGQSLYDQYRFDEPWDGPNNSQLAPAVTRWYSCPSDSTKPPTETSYVAVVGQGTAWPGDEHMAIQDFTDGIGNVLLLVEVHNSGIHWMEPRDLHVAQMSMTINPTQGQGISSGHPNGASVLFADGSVRYFSSDTPPAVLRSLIHIDDGTLPLPP